jgi:hypothetical protein
VPDYEREVGWTGGAMRIACVSNGLLTGIHLEAMRKVLLALVLTSMAVHAQKTDALAGLWQGYDGEWLHCS